MDDFKTPSISIRFFKENLDFEFQSEFLPFVEHFKYREYRVTELRKHTDAYKRVPTNGTHRQAVVVGLIARLRLQHIRYIAKWQIGKIRDDGDGLLVREGGR